jgi:hypothetical protein
VVEAVAAAVGVGEDGTVTVSIDVSFRHDREVNAAAITFDASAKGRELRTYPIEDADGSVIATVTFSPTGALVQIELLDAANQIPRGLLG